MLSAIKMDFSNQEEVTQTKLPIQVSSGSIPSAFLSFGSLGSIPPTTGAFKRKPGGSKDRHGTHTGQGGQGWVAEKLGTGLGTIGEAYRYIYIYVYCWKGNLPYFWEEKQQQNNKLELFCSFFVNTPFLLKSLVGASFFAGCAVGSTARWGLFDHRP